MHKYDAFFDSLTAQALALGANRAAVIPAKAIPVNADFRKLCESNQCGMYGKCWTCPPDIGDVDLLIAQLRTYQNALVYQQVSPLEDSFDLEGMQMAKKTHRQLAQQLQEVFDRSTVKDCLHLGAGGCGICPVCTRTEGKPCRFPDRAIVSLEAYGVDVSQLAKAAGMNYVNGPNTVTYFGMVLFS